MATAPASSSRETSTTKQRVPPQDLDAEKALLGSLMMSRNAIADVIPIIGREDCEWFYVPAHQKIFVTLLDMYDDPTKAIDLIVVSDELRRRDLFDIVGGQDYLIQLAESFADWANAEYYAKIVRDKGMLRDLIRCAGEITEQAYTGMDEAKHILDNAEQRIFNVTEKRVSGQAIEIRSVVNQLAQQIGSGGDGMYTGLPTGFVQLDEYLGGLQAGDFIIVAGRPSMGKTAFGLSVAQHMSLTDNGRIAFFSMEMSNAQLAQRLISAHSGVDAQKIRKQMLSEKEMNKLLHACSDFEQTKLFVDDTPGMTALELRSKVRRLTQQHDIQAVFVDYLQLMYIPGSENRQVEISTISRSLKSLARELNIPIVALAQLNRMAEGRADKRPIMSDLRESGAIEQDADVILLIHREEYYRPEDEEVKNQAEVIIAKQRNGPTGRVTLHFDKKLTRFSNLTVTADNYVPAESYVPAPSNDTVPF